MRDNQKEIDKALIDISRIGESLSGFRSAITNRRERNLLKSVMDLSCDAGEVIVSIADLDIPDDLRRRIQLVSPREGDIYFLEWLRRSGQKVRVLEGNKKLLRLSAWSDVLICQAEETSGDKEKDVVARKHEKELDEIRATWYEVHELDRKTKRNMTIAIVFQAVALVGIIVGIVVRSMR